MKKTILCIILLCLVSVSVQAQWWTKTVGPKEPIAVTYDSKNGFLYSLTDNGSLWKWNNLGWVMLNDTFNTSHVSTSLIFDTFREKLLAININGIWEYTGGKWKKIGKTIDQVWINSLVYDEQDKRLLAFTTHRNKQKTHETWVWNYEKWEKLDIENPSARLSSSSMVWDHTRGKAVLLLKKKSKNKWGIWELEKEGWKLVWGYDYLGGVYQDTMTSVFSPDSGNIYYFTYHGEWRFSWDGVNLSSKKKKSNYFQNYELITSDLKNNRILAVMQDIYYKDTSLKIYKVELNQKRIISDTDMPVFQEKSIFDEERGLLVTLNEFYGKMYFWDGQKWSYYMSNRPRTSTGGGFCFDQIGKRGVYFGGGESPNYPNEDLRYYPVWDNTYVWKNKGLKILDVPSPEARANHAMAYDNSRESVILFGGNNFEWDERNSSNAIISGGIFGDTWELTGSNWQKLASDGPSARFSSTMVFDSHRNKMILFGGVKGEKYGWGKEDYLSDTWELEDGLWKKAAIKGPSARNAPAMVFDVNLKRVMLFGGLNNFDRKISNEVWSWDGILWKKKTIAKSPMNIVADSIHYDRYSGHTFGVLNSWYSSNSIHYFGPYRPTISASTDFDGDGKADPSTFDARGGEWIFRDTGSVKFGKFRDVPAPGDYNGNGKAQMVLYRPDSGSWMSEKGILLENFGKIGDIPVPGDYDGDGRDDMAFFRPSEGLWSINGKYDLTFGQGHDVPVPGDYNGDGKQDIALYRAETGTWLFADGRKIKFGQYQDIPVPADYNGDGKTDIAVYRQSTGQWLFKGMNTVKFGLMEDIPIPADFDGDGKADLALYRPNTGEWVFPDGSSFPLGKPHSTPVH